MEFFCENNVEKYCILLAFIIRKCHDSLYSECQNSVVLVCKNGIKIFIHKLIYLQIWRLFIIKNYIPGNVHYKWTQTPLWTEMRNKIKNAVNIIKTCLAISLLNKCVHGTPENSPAESRFTRHALCIALDLKIIAAEVRGATAHV